MRNRYQVDVWGGDLHQNHVDSKTFDRWTAAAEFMAPLVDAGLLCNVLHTDFQAPASRIDEAASALKAQL